ncbi:MAG: protease modulator HflC [Cellvibrionaceae bacterium]
MSPRSTVSLIIVLIAIFLLTDSVYVVKETERAVKLRFGALISDDIQPGLKLKWPLVDNIRKFDSRVLTLDAQPESYFTVENKRLIVDSFAKWRIINVAKFYKSTGGSEVRANTRLAARINDGLRNEFGTRTVHEVVSGERDQLMAVLRNQVDKVVQNDLGIEVLDVRVKRIDLPDDVSDSVYRRMAANREKEAREHRSQGQEEAEKIRADADRQRTILQAEAYSNAEKIRGEGDAVATATYANAYNRDPEFYSFARSLTAYKESFKNKGDIMVIDPNSDFFRYLNDSKGGRK